MLYEFLVFIKVKSIGISHLFFEATKVIFFDVFSLWNIKIIFLREEGVSASVVRLQPWSRSITEPHRRARLPPRKPR